MDKAHILIVEDEAALLRLTQALLLDEGYNVQAANNGGAALRALEVSRPDLIISDIMMPEMDGYALYDAVRSRPEWTTIPFIFLTAKAEKTDIRRGKELGAEDYITKPFDPEDLIAAVRGRLQRARVVQQAIGADFAQLKQQLVRMLSHELRTPLTTILGYSEFALEEMDTLPPETFQEVLTNIQRGATRLHELTEALLLLVRLDAGQIAREYELEAVVRPDLARVIAAVVSRYEAPAALRGVTLALQPAAEVAPIRLHAAFMADAVGRLLDNAIKFSPRDQGRRVTVEVRPAPGGVEIVVADAGVGIAAADLPHLFERFRQIDRGKLEQQGVGVGLAIAQALIRLHDGEIRVSSVQGQGSTFTIWLPAAATPAA